MTTGAGVLSLAAPNFLPPDQGGVVVTAVLALHMLISLIFALIFWIDSMDDDLNNCDGHEDYEDVEVHVILVWVLAVLSWCACGWAYSAKSGAGKGAPTVKDLDVLQMSFMAVVVVLSFVVGIVCLSFEPEDQGDGCTSTPEQLAAEDGEWEDELIAVLVVLVVCCGMGLFCSSALCDPVRQGFGDLNPPSQSLPVNLRVTTVAFVVRRGAAPRVAAGVLLR